MNPDLNSQAAANIAVLRRNTYFGRLIIAGMSDDGEHVHLATAISGRSQGSQNRRYVLGESGTVSTDVVDPGLGVGDPDLTIYETQMEMHDNKFAISNGRQTRKALEYFSFNSLGEVLKGWEHEPDAPIYTNRITARCELKTKRTDEFPSAFFEFASHSQTDYGTTLITTTKPEKVPNGYSLYLATYAGDGEPPIRFRSCGPRIIPTFAINSIDKLRDTLSKKNSFLVAVSLKTVEVRTGISSVEIWNRHGDKPDTQEN